VLVDGSYRKDLIGMQWRAISLDGSFIV